jgi:hypothetical protein
MKNKMMIIGAMALTTAYASAAISFSSTAAVGLKDNAGTNVVTGDLVLLVVDDGNDGFLNLAATGGAITAGSTSALAARTVAVANTSITAGQTFGGDLILGAYSAASGGSVAPGFSGTIAGYEGQKFALVWFEDSAANLTNLAGKYFGMASGGDWTLPSTDSGNYSFHGTTNTTAAVYWQLASTVTATQLGSNGFFSGTGAAGSSPVKSATFQVIPEPSAALLGALGALGLLRRRRN